MEIEITEIYPFDKMVNYRNDIIGKPFEAKMIISSPFVSGWFTVIGKFKEQTNVPHLDDDVISIKNCKYQILDTE